MKTLKEILCQKPVFIEDFNNEDDVFDAFEIEKPKGVKILYAEYCREGDYDWSAYVLFVKNKKLYDVFGSHCSCHGLEDQWEPIETTIEGILKNRDLSDRPQLREFLGV